MQLKMSTVAPTTGTTVAVPNGVEHLTINPAGTLAALTVNPPPSPLHGQIFNMITSQTLTVLTITPLNSQSFLIAAPTTATAGLIGRWVFDAPSQTWRPN